MLKRMILDNSKEATKFPYPMNAKGFCIHNTDNIAPAINERNNLNRHDNNTEVSFHIVTDENESIQCIEFNRNAWASGDGGSGEGNRNYIHWEIARSHNEDPSLFASAQERAAKDLAEELKKRNWGIDRIKTHRDFSGKNCPSRTDITKFKQKVQAYLNGTNISIPSNNPEINTEIKVGDKVKAIGKYYSTGQEIPAWVKSNTYSVEKVSGNKVLLKEITSWVYAAEVIKVSVSPSAPANPTEPTPNNSDRIINEYSETGYGIPRVTVNVRNVPSTSGNTPVTTYIKGEKINFYDKVLETESYIWISYISSSGARRYIAVKDKKTGERLVDCY